MKRNVLIISDNITQYCKVKEILDNNQDRLNLQVDYACSNISSPIKNHEDFKGGKCKVLNVKKSVDFLIKRYELIISVHCKQLFPKELVESVRCINIHPGYNPINRGWYPQVFAIIEENPIGATIHEMDVDLDHGPIIVRSFVAKYEYDTSLDIYSRVLEKEVELFNNNLDDIFNNSYQTTIAEEEGKLFLKKHFDNLCELNMDEKLTTRELINRLRALSHGNHKNAYFTNKEGNKVYVTINLELVNGK